MRNKPNKSRDKTSHNVRSNFKNMENKLLNHKVKAIPQPIKVKTNPTIIKCRDNTSKNVRTKLQVKKLTWNHEINTIPWTIKIRNKPNNTLPLAQQLTLLTLHIMHDILEGILQYEIKKMLKNYIKVEHYLTLEVLNSWIAKYDFGYYNDKNRPSPNRSYHQTTTI